MTHRASYLVSLGEPNIYHDSGMFYKEVGILLGGCLTVKNLWELLTEGVVTDLARRISV